MKTKDTPVDVNAGETAVVDFKLMEENIRALQEVTVSGNVNRFSKKESVYIARLQLKNLENPQVYNTVPKELFREQVALDLGGISKKGVPIKCLISGSATG